MCAKSPIPEHIANVIDGEEQEASDGQVFLNRNPATGTELCTVARSGQTDVAAAVEAAV